jgi:hypothetical protein
MVLQVYILTRKLAPSVARSYKNRPLEHIPFLNRFFRCEREARLRRRLA